MGTRKSTNDGKQATDETSRRVAGKKIWDVPLPWSEKRLVRDRDLIQMGSWRNWETKSKSTRGSLTQSEKAKMLRMQKKIGDENEQKTPDLIRTEENELQLWIGPKIWRTTKRKWTTQNKM
jgi:hypothetical protein